MRSVYRAGRARASYPPGSVLSRLVRLDRLAAQAVHPRLPAVPDRPGRRHPGHPDPGDGGRLPAVRDHPRPAVAGGDRAGRGAAVHLAGAAGRPRGRRRRSPAGGGGGVRGDGAGGGGAAGDHLRGGSLLSPGLLQLGIYAVIVLGGVCRAFLQPARTALSAQIVPRALYPKAIAWRTGVFQLCAIVGPAFGGLLYGWVGASGAYLATVALLLAALVTMLGVRVPAAGDAAVAGAAADQRARGRALPAGRSHPAGGHHAGSVRGAVRRARWRCCRCSPRTSCRSGPRASACCARRRRSGALLASALLALLPPLPTRRPGAAAGGGRLRR